MTTVLAHLQSALAWADSARSYAENDDGPMAAEQVEMTVKQIEHAIKIIKPEAAEPEYLYLLSDAEGNTVLLDATTIKEARAERDEIVPTWGHQYEPEENHVKAETIVMECTLYEVPILNVAADLDTDKSHLLVDWLRPDRIGHAGQMDLLLGECWSDDSPVLIHPSMQCGHAEGAEHEWVDAVGECYTSICVKCHVCKRFSTFQDSTGETRPRIQILKGLPEKITPGTAAKLLEHPLLQDSGAVTIETKCTRCGALDSFADDTMRYGPVGSLNDLGEVCDDCITHQGPRQESDGWAEFDTVGIQVDELDVVGGEEDD